MYQESIQSLFQVIIIIYWKTISFNIRFNKVLTNTRGFIFLVFVCVRMCANDTRFVIKRIVFFNFPAQVKCSVQASISVYLSVYRIPIIAILVLKCGPQSPDSFVAQASLCVCEKRATILQYCMYISSPDFNNSIYILQAWQYCRVLFSNV